ncbi:hypothetical protein M9Y10_034267 [Tritrichomonas musculus]|uniref:Protein kinase domain-containing protein n=1 Tax=Tritrichomonas musculus TaxID=1915356 RepID=A0ABR2KFB4_9EUKA
MNQEIPQPLTNDTVPIALNSPDNKSYNLIVYKNDIITDGEGNKFLVLSKLGEGQYGQVFEVCEITSPDPANSIFAIKVTKSHPSYREQAQKEADLISYIQNNAINDEMENISKFIKSFLYKNHLIILMEKLSMDLLTIIVKRKYNGLPLNLVQSTVRSILKALSTLSRHNIVHSDLKPENILLADSASEKVKLADFGSSRYISQECKFYIQSRFYRAPEVILAIPHSYPIDIWSLGCVAVEIFVGLPLFPGQNEVQMLILIVQMLGQFPQKMIDMSSRKNVFFNSNGTLKTEIEICRSLQIEVAGFHKYFFYKKLPNIIKQYALNIGKTEAEQRKEQWRRGLFIDLLLKMLVLDPEQRIKPDEALQHPFITTDLQYN